MIYSLQVLVNLNSIQILCGAVLFLLIINNNEVFFFFFSANVIFFNISFQIEEILAKKRFRVTDKLSDKIFYLVRWSGLKKDSWESVTFIKRNKVEALDKFFKWMRENDHIGRCSVSRPEAETSPVFHEKPSAVKLLADVSSKGKNKAKNKTNRQKPKKSLETVFYEISKDAQIKYKKKKSVLSPKKEKVTKNVTAETSKGFKGQSKKISSGSVETEKVCLSLGQNQSKQVLKSEHSNKKSGNQLIRKRGQPESSQKSISTNKKKGNVKDCDEVSQSSGSESGILYSLNPANSPVSAKKLKLHIVDVRDSGIISRDSTPEVDPEITFRLSEPAKRILLKDSIKKKTYKSKPG